MARYEMLDKDKHRQLRIRTGHGAELGDAIMFAMTFPVEFRDVQSCYPILFTKDPNTGGFFAAALFGFESEQNLFLDGDRWDAHYVPAMVERQPFLIATGNEGDTPKVSVDFDHRRVSDDGERLFNDDGEQTDVLKRKIALLDKLHHGLQHGKGFIDALLKHELLEQITLDLTFNDGDKKSVQGFYTIAEERLYSLKGDVLETLNEAGYLQPVFMAVASLSRIRELIERRNRLAA